MAASKDTIKENIRDAIVYQDTLQTIFINEANKGKYIKELLTWLKTDFISRDKPPCHFWHNRRTIKKAFNASTAMVVLKDGIEIVGYMIWSGNENDIYLEIDIIEVKEKCRRQGIAKKMLADLTNKFTSLVVLTASVLRQAEEVFAHVGWKEMPKSRNLRTTEYFKTYKPVAQQLDTLPNGHAIALLSQADILGQNVDILGRRYIDYYMIKAKFDEYKHKMKYFQIEIDSTGKLKTPIVTSYHYEGYLGIYFNQKLIADGKAKHVFNRDGYYISDTLLILDKINPCQPELFTEFLAGLPLPSPQIIAQSAMHEAIPSVATTQPMITYYTASKQRTDGTYKAHQDVKPQQVTPTLSVIDQPLPTTNSALNAEDEVAKLPKTKRRKLS